MEPDRRLRNGQKSWSRVIDRAKLLWDFEVEVNALTVLDDYSVQFPEEIYEFHKSLGINYMQFIPCVELDSKDPSRAASFSISPEKYGRFLCKLFDLWRSDFIDGTPTTSIRSFDSVFYIYVDQTPPDCTLLRECGVYMVVEYNGNVYPCDFFVEPRWKLGNVMENNLTALLNSKRQNEFGAIKAQLHEDCNECRWLNCCRGGCLRDRVHNPQDQGIDFLCQSHKMFFEHADVRLREMAENWKSRQDFASSAPFIYPESNKNSGKKVGRNDPCICGSGIKYKKCCGNIL